ncbi:ArnT family glycosyltransferase [Streptomyces sp. NPDC057617]|uniref:ArnT family glycosyltransferase n=1 Tax=Streptomyces sp. NPDC057617 TaxID=3346184 RepID=UPI0036C4368E
MTQPLDPGAPAVAPGLRHRTPRSGTWRTAPGDLLVRLRLGRPEDAPWVRPAFLALLLAALAVNLWTLGESGYANSFYSAAVQAGGESWKAFFFGSSDAANSITVDKPPAALWPMALSVRLFGLGSWQILVPEALMGVGTIAVLYAAVRRHFSAAAGLLAAGVLALTPVAALMFRFNNPDALLALLMTVSVYCVLRALEGARTRWLVWAGVAMGFAFLTKTLQAFLILPPLALVYAVCAPTSLRRRAGQLGAAALALVVGGGWWVAIVELWPADSRPYIGGSQNNSFLELTFGYNGLGRINGEEAGSVGGGGRGGGETGLGRMFSDSVGGQISWLLPAALFLFVVGLVLTRRAGRTDAARAAFLLWGGALLMTAGVFSFMAGIFHEYYTVALAPYIAALVGMGVTMLWQERAGLLASAALGVTVAGTSVWAFVLLGRTPDYLPWLRWAVLVGGLIAGLGLTGLGRIGRDGRLRTLAPRLTVGAVALAVAASLAAPLAYTFTTVNAPHTGSIVTAGPAVARGGGGGGMRMQGAAAQAEAARAGGTQRDGALGGGAQQGAARAGGQTRGGNRGGLLDGPAVPSELIATLRKDAGDYTWVAATIGSQIAASNQLAAEEPVMSIGGFNGSDPSPTLAQFKQYVADGEIHYFLAGPEEALKGGVEAALAGSRGGGPGGENSTELLTWVDATFKKVTVNGTTLYDLTAQK